MRRLSSSKRVVVNNGVKGEIEWELRPGGMLVQKRNMGDASSAPMIKIKVSHGSYHHDIALPAQSTFGDLKIVVAQETGLEPKEQRLLFQGKEKDDEECLHMVGVKDMSKVVLLEDPATKERKLEEMNRNQTVLKACEEAAKVRSEVDKLSEKVIALEASVGAGTKIAENEFLVLTELLMVQLLQLDSIEADGEAKVQRRVELESPTRKQWILAQVRRVQGIVDNLDKLKARNSNPFSSSCNAMAVSSKWEAFESGLGIGSQAPLPSSTIITQEWEVFD
ncbi:BCL-2-associated athanoprotein 4 isoform 2 [Hibiscus syriacus]|uniref:BCL-2-associated athanoprotein 4 isoform 2 n=1 Tax=Hibiscus syriacus TaxID=106335 RepID=A0A6A2X048_HIBSY|nr:BAG family molecular chaperone regulator 4-like isoform X1 [Hibiscus syriacus]KAE8655286.1 BCL-2-associated athanoprotein 4 isoform 2 [Hibiscus syriacus]